MAPVPGSYALLDNLEIKIYDSSIINETYKGNNGEIVSITKEGIIVKTKDSAICIKELKPFSKKRMKAIDYVNGIGKDKLIGKVFK